VFYRGLRQPADVETGASGPEPAPHAPLAAVRAEAGTDAPAFDGPKHQPALVVNQLTKRFAERTAFSDVSFQVAYGEVFGFLLGTPSYSADDRLDVSRYIRTGAHWNMWAGAPRCRSARNDKIAVTKSCFGDLLPARIFSWMWATLMPTGSVRWPRSGAGSPRSAPPRSR